MSLFVSFSLEEPIRPETDDSSIKIVDLNEAGSLKTLSAKSDTPGGDIVQRPAAGQGVVEGRIIHCYHRSGHHGQTVIADGLSAHNKAAMYDYLLSLKRGPRIVATGRLPNKPARFVRKAWGSYVPWMPIDEHENRRRPALCRKSPKWKDSSCDVLVECPFCPAPSVQAAKAQISDTLDSNESNTPQSTLSVATTP